MYTERMVLLKYLKFQLELKIILFKIITWDVQIGCKNVETFCHQRLSVLHGKNDFVEYRFENNFVGHQILLEL